MLWTQEKLKIARDILGKYASYDYAHEQIQDAIGKVSKSSVRNAFYAAGLKSPTKHLRKGVTSSIKEDLPTPELSIEYGRRADAVYVRSLERQVGRRGYLADRLEVALKRAFAANPIKLSPCRLPTRTVPGRRLVTLLASDIHFGLNVDPREVPGGGYNWLIASRRMARLAAETVSWKERHREETDLQVTICGDLLAGRIHLDDAGIRPLTEQIHGATMIMVPFLDYLSQHFQRVHVSCLPGNHDRVTRERQIANRWDAHSHAVYLAIAQAFRQSENVTVDVPLTGDCAIELPGGKSLAFYTHGDVRPTVANVGKSLDLKPMIANLNRLNSSGEFKKPVRLLACGHWHSPFVAPAGTGTVIVNGCVIGADAFARNGCGIFGDEGTPMQIVFESVPGYEFGDSRFIRLREADNDPIYDKIIRAPDLDVWSVAS